LKLKTPGIAGTIHWLGAQLILTNVTGSFYGGKGNGFADFDFTAPHSGVDYQFSVEVTNVNLHSLSVDLSSATNHLEGTFAGLLAVTNASSEDWRSWNGYGHVNLRDGLLWDIRLFSIMSPVMNAIIPGVGNSRATDASAKFSITNGMISTDSLEIRTKQMRLEYVGAVSLKQDVDARVTAQLLRDAPMIGPLISKALWPVSKLFEYKVTGTLADPKLEPVYVPTRILLLPLQIFRSVGDLLPGDSSNSTAP
ncbi:MAG TPA: AsmA-like C-terminal region-containing protein, partial [Verrucomicrobiae bacterium]|nr:AsmA-like C-terminal region-containing protein [Verrucomicrobiae bacterium]